MNVGRRGSHNTSRSKLNTSQSTIGFVAQHKSERRHQIHQNSWLCSLIPPKFFFVSLYLVTITFWTITGMACGGKVSGRCPLGVLQAFAIFNENGRDELRKTTNDQPPSLIILLFAWFSITASAFGLFAFRRAHQYALHGRYINGRTLISVNPMYLLTPSILGYVFTFLLLLFWTFFVVEDQVRDIVNKSPDAKLILTFIFMTLLPLMTIWAGFFYVAYGLVRSILFMRALLKGWSLPPPLPQHCLKNPSSAPGSFRRYHHRELSQTISSRRIETTASMEPLNPLETTATSTRSQKLESILEMPEQ
uniref:Uncharacterized protein n=1 Tax=Panagrolaimus superbus TaxID=310955 RepID=A0A914Z1X0_9BILA